MVAAWRDEVAWRLHPRFVKTSTANDECVAPLSYFSNVTLSVRENLDTAGVECVTLSSEMHFASHRNSYYHVSACGGDEIDLYIVRILTVDLYVVRILTGRYCSFSVIADRLVYVWSI
jgi:hypothetical protein